MEAPKSREEWVRAMDEIIWQYEHGGFGNWMKSRDASIDSIMALQSRPATAPHRRISPMPKAKPKAAKGAA